MHAEDLIQRITASKGDLGLFMRDFSSERGFELQELEPFDTLSIFLTMVTFYRDTEPFIGVEDPVLARLLGAYPPMSKFLNKSERDGQDVYELGALRYRPIWEVIPGSVERPSEKAQDEDADAE